MQASDVMEGGILAGNASPGREVGRDPGAVRERIVADLPAFIALAEELGTTPARLSVAFTLTHPATATTLFGASRLEQVRSNLEAVALVDRLDAETIRARVAPFWADRDVVDPEGP